MVRAAMRRGRGAPASEATRLLGEVPLFSGLTKKELTAIAGAAKEVTHRAGSVLAREGESGIGFFVISDGTAQVSIRDRKRGKLGRGDFFGEISLLDQGPRTATITAETDVTTIGLTAWDFRRLIESNPSIASKMLKIMAQRLRASSKSVTD